jgi:hypothetical protein
LVPLHRVPAIDPYIVALVAVPKPHKEQSGMKRGVLCRIGPVVAAVAAFASIQAAAGRSAAVWFGVGFIVAAVLAMWEAGAKREIPDD